MDERHIAPQRGTLHISLHDAKGLRAADAAGLSSDPHATIGLGQSPSAEDGTLVQSTIIHQTLSPQWEENFEVPRCPTQGTTLCLA